MEQLELTISSSCRPLSVLWCTGGGGGGGNHRFNVQNFHRSNDQSHVDSDSLIHIHPIYSERLGDLMVQLGELTLWTTCFFRRPTTYAFYPWFCDGQIAKLICYRGIPGVTGFASPPSLSADGDISLKRRRVMKWPDPVTSLRQNGVLTATCQSIAF